MATAFTALYYSGGPKIDGTLREININRGSQTVASIDFYDFALKGDRSKDVRLQDGDILFVHTVGRRVALIGKFRHPAIYEIKPGENLSDIIKIGGGLEVDADFRRLHIERIIPFNERDKYEKNILDLDVTFTSADSLLRTKYEIIDGDVVSIYAIRGELQNRVSISGNVKHAGVLRIIPRHASKRSGIAC